MEVYNVFIMVIQRKISKKFGFTHEYLFSVLIPLIIYKKYEK